MYLIFKLIHVLAVIVFVGNITVGIFWKAYADSTRNPQVIAYTIAGIIRADRIFTIPAIIVLLIAGFGAAGVAQLNPLTTGWILWGLGLFIIAGICFGPIARTQRALRDLAQEGANKGTMDWARYEQLSGRWSLFGTIATLTPLVAVVIMVLKPALPAF